MKKLFVMLMAIVTAVAMLCAGCGGDKKAAPSKEAPKAKILRVATEPSFAPFEFQKEGSKEFTGFDIDLIKALGTKAGYKVEVSNMGFDALIPALQAGNIDVAIAGMTITDERKKVVDFTAPYYDAGLIVVVHKDNNTIKGFKDLNNKKLAVQIGTTGEKQAHKVPGAKVTAFNTNVEATMELKTGGAEAVINDRPVAEYFLATGGGDKFAKTVGDVLEAEQYGIAVKKGNKELLDALNKALADAKKDGTYDKIYKTWFGAAKK